MHNKKQSKHYIFRTLGVPHITRAAKNLQKTFAFRPIPNNKYAIYQYHLVNLEFTIQTSLLLIYLKRCKSEYLFCLKEQFDLTDVMHPFGHKQIYSGDRASLSFHIGPSCCVTLLWKNPGQKSIRQVCNFAVHGNMQIYSIILIRHALIDKPF